MEFRLRNEVDRDEKTVVYVILWRKHLSQVD